MGRTGWFIPMESLIQGRPTLSKVRENQSIACPGGLPCLFDICPEISFWLAGSGTDGGILPRSLTTIFNSIGTRQYRAMNLKPFLSSQATWLDSKQVCQEEAKKQALISGRAKEASGPSSLSNLW